MENGANDFLAQHRAQTPHPWEKKAENYQALIMLASAFIVYRLIVLG